MLNVCVWIKRPHHSCTIFGTNHKHLTQHTGVSQPLYPKSVPTEHTEEEAFLWWGQLLPSTFQSNITVKYNIQCSFKALIQTSTQNSWNAYSHPLAYTYYGFLPFQDRGIWPALGHTSVPAPRDEIAVQISTSAQCFLRGGGRKGRRERQMGTQ